MSEPVSPKAAEIPETEAPAKAEEAAKAEGAAKVEAIRVGRGEDGLRLDRWFRARFPNVTQSHLQKLLRTGQVRVDKHRAQTSDRLTAGMEVRVPAMVRAEAPTRAPLKASIGTTPGGSSKADRALIEAMILYEDDSVLVLNKPFGLAVQGGTGTRHHLDGILAGMADRFGDRPRLVHRLDRDTTGVLLVAKTRDAAAKLGRTFQTRSAGKTYWAIVNGVPRPSQGKIEAALVKASSPDGDRVRKARPGEQDVAQHATTHYSVIDHAAHKAAWVSLKPVTGRQHQLRAHMAMIGHPILGDTKYEDVLHGGQSLLIESGVEGKLHLHARRLIIPHPHNANKSIDVTAPLPEHMQRTFALFGFDLKRFGKHGEE